MKDAVIFAALVILLSSLAVADEAAESSPGTNEEQITQTISLQPGWNSVSFKVSGLTFSEDIKPQCSFRWYNKRLEEEGVSPDDISEDNRYHVWTQEGGSWSHPDELDVSEGYSFNVGSECELEVSGQRKRVQNFKLEDGWNLVNVPSGLSMGRIKEDCNLRWYNYKLEEGVSPEDISEDERQFFWVNDGNSWRDPYEEDDHRGDDGVYINSNGVCEIDSWSYDESDDQEPGYVVLDSSSISTYELAFGESADTFANVSNHGETQVEANVTWTVGGEVVSTVEQPVEGESYREFSNTLDYSKLRENNIFGDNTVEVILNGSSEYQSRVFHSPLEVLPPVRIEDVRSFDEEVWQSDSLIVQADVISDKGSTDVTVEWYLGDQNITVREQRLEYQDDSEGPITATLQNEVSWDTLIDELGAGEYSLKAKFNNTEDTDEEFVQAGNVRVLDREECPDGYSYQSSSGCVEQ